MKYNPENHSVVVEAGDSIAKISSRFPAETEIPLPENRTRVRDGDILAGDLCFDICERAFAVVDDFVIGSPVSDLHICVR